MAELSPEIELRNHFGHLLNCRGLTDTAAEIGVDKAGFAVALLRQWQGALLWCIDPWQTDLPGYNDPLIKWDRTIDMQIAAAALAPFAQRVNVIRDTSRNAAPMIPVKLDFCYLDGNHSAESIRADLELWWPKIQPEGILAGHDYHPAHQAVIDAVEDFARQIDRPVYLTNENYASWYIYKDPETLLRPTHKWLLRRYWAEEKAK